MPDEPMRAGAASLLSTGMVITLCLAVGFGLGWALDAAAGTSPAFSLVGLLLGIVAATCYTVVSFRRQLKQ